MPLASAADFARAVAEASARALIDKQTGRKTLHSAEEAEFTTSATCDAIRRVLGRTDLSAEIRKALGVMRVMVSVHASMDFVDITAKEAIPDEVWVHASKLVANEMTASMVAAPAAKKQADTAAETAEVAAKIVAATAAAIATTSLQQNAQPSDRAAGGQQSSNRKGNKQQAKSYSQAVSGKQPKGGQPNGGQPNGGQPKGGPASQPTTPPVPARPTTPAAPAQPPAPVSQQGGTVPQTAKATKAKEVSFGTREAVLRRSRTARVGAEGKARAQNIIKGMRSDTMDETAARAKARKEGTADGLDIVLASRKSGRTVYSSPGESNLCMINAMVTALVGKEPGWVLSRRVRDKLLEVVDQLLGWSAKGKYDDFSKLLSPEIYKQGSAEFLFGKAVLEETRKNLASSTRDAGDMQDLHTAMIFAMAFGVTVRLMSGDSSGVANATAASLHLQAEPQTTWHVASKPSIDIFLHRSHYYFEGPEDMSGLPAHSVCTGVMSVEDFTKILDADVATHLAQRVKDGTVQSAAPNPLKRRMSAPDIMRGAAEPKRSRTDTAVTSSAPPSAAGFVFGTAAASASGTAGSTPPATITSSPGDGASQPLVLSGSSTQLADTDSDLDMTQL